MMDEARDFPPQPFLIPTRISLWTKKNSALIVIHSVNLTAGLPRKVGANFGADKSGRTGDKYCFHALNPVMPQVPSTA